MSEKRARYVGGSMTGVDIVIPFKDGDNVSVHVSHGGELPTELPDGRKVPASFRNSLLEQGDNWTEVNRATGAEATGKTTTAKAEKEGDR
jgi:hypothetical protein